jgi:hypothetical protein
VFILDAYIVTVERSAETEIPQQRRGEVLQQSVKKLIIRPVACVMSGVNGARLSAAEEISLRNKKTKSESIKHNNTVTHLCKPSIAEQGSVSSTHRRLYTPLSNMIRNRDCLSSSSVRKAVWSLSESTYVRASMSASWAVGL